MATRRLFFALWPDAATAERLRQAVSRHGITGGRMPALEDLHVTVCFLGAVDPGLLPELCERVAAIRAEPFELAFERLEYWRRSRVLAATSAGTPAALQALASELRRQCRAIGLPMEERPLRAHVSLVRSLSGADGLARESPRLSESLTLAADTFYLAQSQELEPGTAGNSVPPRYRRLHAWALRAIAGSREARSI